MTLDGTNSYVLFTADDTAAVMIDPGPELEAHLQELGELVGDRELRGIVLTHHLSLIHISEPTRREWLSRMPSSA